MTKTRAAGTTEGCFKLAPSDPSPPAAFHHSTVEGADQLGDTCLALTIHRWGAGPT